LSERFETISANKVKEVTVNLALSYCLFDATNKEEATLGWGSY